MAEGVCPNCGSEELDYGKLVVNATLYYPYVCNDCNFKGKEWYTLLFARHTDFYGTEM